ncbi:cation-translocating P-type ATPase [Alterileibacterium massiliense]|uniref:cation-translocating P-type ATPase n=1 Tax=Alterileibacterium massiliense TaxID=1870997 RepID=UPI000AB4CCB5
MEEKMAGNEKMENTIINNKEKYEDYYPYLEPASEVLEKEESRKNGLKSSEADERLKKFGKNKLIEQKKRSTILRFLDQIKDPMILVLLAAALLSFATAIYQKESPADVFIILFVVILNSVLGVIQENKAEEAIDALKKMTAATSKVKRDGKIINIKSEDLVRGDIIILEAGDAVPADGRIIECASLKIEESALTGESVPVTKEEEMLEIPDGEKGISLGDRKNMIYMGSTVVYGRGKAVITGTGMDTEMGKIADAISQAKEELTPLQKKLAQLSKILTIAIGAICVLVFLLGIIEAKSVNIDVMIDTFMLAISLAVAAIPEGLVAVVTIVLSIGVTKMSKRNAVIRKITAVETLGCAQVICSDKTGTLTQNKMTVVDYSSPYEKLLATGMALASDAEEVNAGNEVEIIGEPTEAALVKYASEKGIKKAEIIKDYPRIGEAPFDSGRKMMSTVHHNRLSMAISEGDDFISDLISKSNYVQFTKGAPDVVLKKCTHILENGEIVNLDEEKKKKVNERNLEMASKALRVLSLAIRLYDDKPNSFDSKELEKDMVFVGLTGMIDPVRPEAKEAVQECRQAGIRPIMITGDQLDTAVAIAKELEIIESEDEAILGARLDDMTDEELTANIGTYSVYARVQPEHKVRIVKAWQANKMITAMTGDGVNDAPAIKTADIGVGMGITGTDVTKNVADMILADDNFATIVSAVEEGRRVYANIRKAIQFLLASNISEVLAILTATLLSFTILEPAHILWINLITDSLPALALGLEIGEKDAMRRKPRRSNEGVFSGGLGTDTLYQGVLITILILTAYFLGHYMETGVFEITESKHGITMAFLTMSMCEIFHSFNMRSRVNSIFTIKNQNKWLWLSAGAALLLTTVVISVEPIANLFEFTEISIREYSAAMVLAFMIIPLVEIAKLIKRKLGHEEQ